MERRYILWIIEGKDCYHYYEKYKDPMTGKWKRAG